MTTRRWTVEIFIDEHEDASRTRAEARLHTGDPTRLTGLGQARKRPGDTGVPEIGDELAAARALSDLSHQLLDAAAGDIEAVAAQQARLPG